MNVRCLRWREDIRGTRQGFATIILDPPGLEIRDVVVHQHPESGVQWAQLPASPCLDRNGQPIKNERGRVNYYAYLKWADTDAGREFSKSVIRAVQDFELGISSGDLLV